MKKRRKHDEHDNVERWMISYADFVTLLFAFFTTMYAISQVDPNKFEKVVESMRTAFKSDTVRSSGPIIEGITPINPDVIRLEKEFRKTIDTLNTKEDIEVRRDERGVIISLGDQVLFEAGQAIIKEAAIPTLTAIASIIQKLPNNVTVEGHTDNVPMSSSKYASNWELSTARATSVLNYLLKNYNLSPARFSAAGYAEFKPIAPNTIPSGRAKNRRVDIVVIQSVK